MANTGTVIPLGLNLRRPAGGTIVKVLPQNLVVEILEDHGEFLKVLADGETGFVKASLIKRNQASVSPAPTNSGFHFQGDKAVAPDGTVFGKKFKLGIFNNGQTTIASFVQAHAAVFQDISPSRLRVMQAVSANEGKLEAINTWDNAFLTFGTFQWTVGAEEAAGELAGLLSHLKQTDAAAFDQLFGQFGIDVASLNSPAGQPPTGFLSLDGVKIKTAADKQKKLRTLQRAFQFFKSGQDDRMRQAEIEYAAARIDLFYRENSHKVRGRFLADFISSELGVGLILDQHVNRPAHVPATISSAVDQFIDSTGKNDPSVWSDADERKVLDIYIQRRNNTSMTDSQARADRVRQAVAAGMASDKRDSFIP
jgi:hypothetical protein